MRYITLLAVLAMALLVPQIAAGATDIYGNEIKEVDGVTYQYLVSGNPETAATVNSSPRSSSSTSLVSGTPPKATASVSLEARFRTWLESLGTALKSTKFRHFIINFH